MSKLVKCKSCDAEIAKSAKACPQCGAKNKHGCLSSILGVLVLFFVLIVIIVAIGGDDEPTVAPNGGSEGQSQTSQTNASSVETTAGSNSGFGVGERVEMNNIYVTLDNVTESQGSTYNTPAEGNVFIICEFTIENDSSSALTISSMLSFTAYADDYAVSYSLGGMMETDKQQLDGTVAAGKKMNGTVAF